MTTVGKASKAHETPFRDRGPISDPDALALLATGEIDVLGRMPWSSNATLLCDIRAAHRDAGAQIVQAIYKPHRGERPLWDFPSGLFKREVAAYELSAALGWGLVPPTVLRDGPAGPGSMQLFVPAEFDEHYFTLQEEEAHRATFLRLAVFDFVANSTDRKSGHCLLGQDGHIYAIDNGLSFHCEFKLRTVLWDFAGDVIPSAIVEDLMSFVEADFPEPLAALLDPFEIDAITTRARALINEGRYPTDPSGRRWPWPLV